MDTVKTTVIIDKRMMARFRPVMARNGWNLSSFVRKSIMDKVEEWEAIQAGKTQVLKMEDSK